MSSSHPLPPGQRDWPTFPRFGLPMYAKTWPDIPDQPALAIDGDVATPGCITLDDMSRLKHLEQVSDFHCVCTWTRRNVCWGGVRFKDVYEEIIVPQFAPRGDVAYVRAIGSDGYRADLHLEDALHPDVLIADMLDGQPLSLTHGAPLRLVTPAQYGYKSVRHVRKLLFTHAPKKIDGLRGHLVHPRGRVALEERSVGMPGLVFRWIYRSILPMVLWYYRRYDRDQ